MSRSSSDTFDATLRRVPRTRRRNVRTPANATSTGYARVFISYCHSDSVWMERFRRELNAALFNKATVWCDQDIGGGTNWENRLQTELDRADVALVLATTEYLQSKWCRREQFALVMRYFQENGLEPTVRAD